MNNGNSQLEIKQHLRLAILKAFKKEVKAAGLLSDKEIVNIYTKELTTLLSVIPGNINNETFLIDYLLTS